MILIDTGPIVAYLDRRDHYHEWAMSQFSRLPTPYMTCEAVCVEVTHLLSRAGLDPNVLLELIFFMVAYPDACIGSQQIP